MHRAVVAVAGSDSAAALTDLVPSQAETTLEAEEEGPEAEQPPPVHLLWQHPIQAVAAVVSPPWRCKLTDSGPKEKNVEHSKTEDGRNTD